MGKLAPNGRRRAAMELVTRAAQPSNRQDTLGAQCDRRRVRKARPLLIVVEAGRPRSVVRIADPWRANDTLKR